MSQRIRKTEDIPEELALRWWYYLLRQDGRGKTTYTSHLIAQIGLCGGRVIGLMIPHLLADEISGFTKTRKEREEGGKGIKEERDFPKMIS